MTATEVNFDGLIGPTHNYAGLSPGNVASETHGGLASHPKAAALQGLEKMLQLHRLGVRQAVIPPHYRPSLSTLKALGYAGSDVEILRTAAQDNPELLVACSSASSMWTANAATASPGADTADHLLHLTPANLMGNFHRSIEAEETGAILRAIFPDPARFRIHPPLPRASAFADEGAANHTRLSADYASPGIHFFVYGRKALGAPVTEPVRYPARQTLESCQAIARLHQLAPESVIFAQQSPEAIDAGAFHNDVVAVGDRDLFFHHERAFDDEMRSMAALEAAFQRVAGRALQRIRVTEAEVSLANAVQSYLFNSQLVGLPDGKRLLLCPIECQENAQVSAYLSARVGQTGFPIQQVVYVNLRQSMFNGGGPACLRLRVILSDAELAAVAQGVLFTDALYLRLKAWIEKHYRKELRRGDLLDPRLHVETKAAFQELGQILGLPGIYPA